MSFAIEHSKYGKGLESMEQEKLGKTLLFYNGDWHKQRPLRFADCFAMPVDELLSIFHSGNYRKNTGTFLMTDCLAKNIDAEHVLAYDFDRLKNSGASTIVTNALHCFSPRYVFNKEYWQKILDLNTRLVPMTLGFRYHENGKFHLTKDMLYILRQIAERNEIGVRGEYAAEILNSYGIKNLRIVGCPSLFYHMDREFQVINTPRQIRRINFNFNQCFTDYFQTHVDFWQTARPIFDYFLAQFHSRRVQVDYTLQTAFLKEVIGYDNFIGWEVVKAFVMERGRYFFSVDDWMTALKMNDISIGTQFHGNVAAILARTPALMIAIDKRMEELARYHRIPYIMAEDFNPNKTVGYYQELCDYARFNSSYAAAYDTFVDYCIKNGVTLKVPTGR